MLKLPSSFLAIAVFIGLAPLAHAQVPASSQATTLSPKAQYEAEYKQATARYNGDQKLCNDDPDSASRMQCKRDAKAEYDKNTAQARARMAAAGKPVPAQAACNDCGQVISVHQTEKKGEGSGLGMVAGGVLGGVLGHQIGGGVGKTLATVGGAAGGAYAGNTIEKNVKSSKIWTVAVKYPNGTTANFEFADAPGFKVGDTVRNSGKTIVRP
jgi:outer membrane lipoprotein SlyB